MVHYLESQNLSIPFSIGRGTSDGGGGWPLKEEILEDWAWWDNTFTMQELDAIIKIGESDKLEPGRVGNGEIGEFRDSDVRFLYPNTWTNWVFARFADVAKNANSQFFNFDLSGFDQGLQFTKYDSNKQHYEWHIDRGVRNVGIRKLSMVLQLSDPDTYEGGDLQIRIGKDPISIPRKRGLIALFPSYVLHRVTPVTEGTRYSLVAWISGPPFK